MKKSISQSEKMSMIGLLTVGENLNNQLRQVEKSMMKIVGEEAESGMGHCSDFLYGVESYGPDKEEIVNDLLDKLKIIVSE